MNAAEERLVIENNVVVYTQVQEPMCLHGRREEEEAPSVVIGGPVGRSQTWFRDAEEKGQCFPGGLLRGTIHHLRIVWEKSRKASTR
ncbi:hypothetical protein CDAR_60441 [Caerostris darwini]|uniref:Uncharacterized protein n=1 Tax=Caerostris darwini TaxID=1538125 RepID=A0AAV4QJC6_9ARAC|nr:hypothetical protein CDAR_60441 [Caerostris darwini]